MKSKPMSKAVSLIVLLALLVGAVVSTVSAQGTPVAASSVIGVLIDTGSKHYMGLKVLDQSKPVKVVMDYRQDSPALDGGSGFYLFDEQTFQKFISFDNQANLAAGTLDSSSGLKQKIAIINDPVGTFSIVTYNDSNTALDYTLTAENALIVDDSGAQVTNASAAAREVAAVESATEEAAAEEAVAVATVADSTTVSETAVTATPRTVTTPVITRAESLQGDLAEQFSKHYFDLAVGDINESVEISLFYDPQDQPNLDNGFNVYAFTSDQFQSMFQGGLAPTQATNTAAGTLPTVDGLKVMRATINSPFTIYTLIVGNDSTVPVSYTLTVGNGLLVDASGQSNTAKALLAGSADEMETDGAITATTDKTTPDTTTDDPTVVAGEIYVVKAGDTIATIARAAYGDVNLWDELCAFNSLANCDLIEVGDQITVPAQADLGTGAVAVTATPVAAITPATTTATTVAPITATELTTTTTPAETTSTPDTTASGTIIDVATNAGQFEILRLALSLANLEDGLKADGPFTLFAPADAAFAGLPGFVLDVLLADSRDQVTFFLPKISSGDLSRLSPSITDQISVTQNSGPIFFKGQMGEDIRDELLSIYPNESEKAVIREIYFWSNYAPTLEQVLQFHVVPQKLTTADITDGMSVDTLMGQQLTFAVSDGKVTVDGANINASELPASNGSVFIIDAVLLPAQ